MTDRADQDLLALDVRLFFDEDVSASIVDNLRQRGFDVTSARDTGRLRLDDASQLDFAADEGRTIVTHNRMDFERLHQRSEGQEHYGIIVAKRRSCDTAVVVKLLHSSTK
jgi:predicted nuclease of predicted toxin-antitoxin system